MRVQPLFTLILITLLTYSCNDLIEYSPYEGRAQEGSRNMNVSAIKKLSEQSTDTFKPFTMAIIGDSHTYYDDFIDQIYALNSLDSIDMVIHMGDITLSGIYREFLWYRDIIKPLKHPLITVIGNHDCLSNGEFMYRDMFGNTNFFFTYNNCLLVFFDDITWERNTKDPDFEWIDSTISTPDSYTYKFVFAHIPPWDEQFSMGNGMLYNYLLDKSNVTYSIHGHIHKFYHDKHYADIYGDVNYLACGDSQDREIVLVRVKKQDIDVEVIRY
ncbi:metallophosphoesterase family protein [Tenuifilum thalassicum]|uniref:Metallophosphoesterase n=1 Tax=Tenuifilum thalassicum TaxID=2590900 RepID=A0A7D4BY46_9BACT|nr:metallophosphoesterase [Tenuifilum thalassicum]QKG78824.1 metallophosphoesterase [Tenuifilum thalassicum]